MPRPFSKYSSAWRALCAVVLCIPLFAAIPCSLVAQSQSASQQSGAPDSSAAAMAAARKKQFDQDEQRLEEGGNNQEVPAANPEQTLFVSPAIVAMLNGEEHTFMVFDIEGHDLTARAQWSLSNSNIADLSPGGAPTVTAKAIGSVTLRARVGTQEATAELKVYEGSSLPMGTVKWQAPEIPGYKTRQITPAVPSANGPDVFDTETNDAGETLIRAFLADGRQLWMTRMAPSGAPGANGARSFPQIIQGFPHP